MFYGADTLDIQQLITGKTFGTVIIGYENWKFAFLKLPHSNAAPNFPHTGIWPETELYLPEFQYRYR
jgi:hypothetical protein